MYNPKTNSATLILYTAVVYGINEGEGQVPGYFKPTETRKT